MCINRFLQILFITICLYGCNQPLENTGVPPAIIDTASTVDNKGVLQIDSLKDLSSFYVNANYLALDSELNIFLQDSSFLRTSSYEACAGDACYRHLKIVDSINDIKFYIIKGDFGEYGFMNAEYYFKNDQLVMLRKFERTSEVNAYNATETLYFFEEFYVTIHSRNRPGNTHLDYSVAQIPFTVTEIEITSTLNKALEEFSSYINFKDEE